MNQSIVFGINTKLNYSAKGPNINNSTTATTSKYFKTNGIKLNNLPDITESNGNVSTSNFNSNVAIRNESAANTSTAETKEHLALKQKKNDGSDYRIFTGTAERIIKWNRVYQKFCYYEVISSVISIQEGSVRLQKIMLLKDKKGPILQVVHYVSDHINIDDFHVDQMLRCVGRMIGPNTLHAVSIRAAMPSEVSNLPRLCYICDHAISKTM